MKPLTLLQLEFIRVASPEHAPLIRELQWQTERYGEFVHQFDEKREELGVDDWRVTTDQELYFLGRLVELTEQRMDEITVILRRVLHRHFDLPESPLD